MSLNGLLIWIGEKLCREKLEIPDPCGNGLYLTRYYILGGRRTTYALMLHRFHQSDMDRDLHDHPWPFWSLILTGGYWEVTPPFRPHFYGPGSFLRRPAAWVHRVAIREWDKPWTLVLRFKYERKWGFHTKDGWVAWNTYDYKKGCE